MDWKLGKWSAGRAVMVLASAVLSAVLVCFGEASGWHGVGSMYHVTPFPECFLSAKFPILLVICAVALAWITRNSEAS